LVACSIRVVSVLIGLPGVVLRAGGLGAQQDAAEADDPADQAAAEPAGAAAAPDAEGHRQAARGGAGGHRANQGTGPLVPLDLLLRVESLLVLVSFLANRMMLLLTLLQVEHIIREENMMAAQEILELFCELIAVRLPIIEAQKSVPLSLSISQPVTADAIGHAVICRSKDHGHCNLN
jgi:hypothetical protein